MIPEIPETPGILERDQREIPEIPGIPDMPERDQKEANAACTHVGEYLTYLFVRESCLNVIRRKRTLRALT